MKLDWSPDEKFAIFKVFADPQSPLWTGFRYELATGEKRPLDANSKYTFTGQGGELLHTWISEVSHEPGTTMRVALNPEGNTAEHSIFQFAPSNPANGWIGAIPPVRSNPDSSLFAVPISLGEEHGEALYELVDRKGNHEPIAGTEVPSSPFQILGFSHDSRALLGYRNSQLVLIQRTP